MQIKLSFLGAAGNVTGSRHLLEVNGVKVLVDCGLYQEREFRHRNWDEFPVPPSQIDAVLLTHAHLDHCGLVPKLVKEGFKGRIHCTDATAEIAKIVMADCGHIMEEDAAYKKKRHKREGRIPPRPVQPLYTVQDAQACENLFSTVRYEQTVKIADGVEATFYDAGHILGASIIKVKVQFDGETRTVLFSGDIGRDGKPILCDPTVFEEADYVLIESTYGDRDHESVDDIKNKIAKAVNWAIESGGNIVIPSFSIERSQEVMYYFNQLHMEKKIPHMMVFLDSPMAIRVTKVFKEHPEMFDKEMKELLRNHDSPFDFEGLKMSLSTKESKAINQIHGTVVIIAGSGMCTGGRVKHHLVNNITRPECIILFVGYQAMGTLGRQIADGAKEVRLHGQKFPVKAKVARVHGFSAHADRNEMLKWLSSMKKAPKQIFIVHGEKSASQSFADFLIERLGWNVTVPRYQDQIVID
jgi:metallo-beta-lactamase family protein